MVFLDYVLLLLSLFLIMLVVFQPSKDSLESAFSGEKTELFKNQKQRGPELFLSRATFLVAILFMVLVFIITGVIHPTA